MTTQAFYGIGRGLARPPAVANGAKEARKRRRNGAILNPNCVAGHRIQRAATAPIVTSIRTRYDDIMSRDWLMRPARFSASPWHAPATMIVFNAVTDRADEPCHLLDR